MSYSELRQMVIATQKEISAINHKLENPAIKRDQRVALSAERHEIFARWQNEISHMRAHPDYTGAWK